MWDLIVSVPDHCLSFYFELFVNCCCRGLGRLERYCTVTNEARI